MQLVGMAKKELMLVKESSEPHSTVAISTEGEGTVEGKRGLPEVLHVLTGIGPQYQLHLGKCSDVSAARVSLGPWLHCCGQE